MPDCLSKTSWTIKAYKKLICRRRTLLILLCSIQQKVDEEEEEEEPALSYWSIDTNLNAWRYMIMTKLLFYTILFSWIFLASGAIDVIRNYKRWKRYCMNILT